MLSRLQADTGIQGRPEGSFIGYDEMVCGIISHFQFRFVPAFLRQVTRQAHAIYAKYFKYATSKQWLIILFYYPGLSRWRTSRLI